MTQMKKRLLSAVLAVSLASAMAAPALAAPYMPDVTREMDTAGFWADLCPTADEVLMTPEEIRAQNQVNTAIEDNHLCDLRSQEATYHGSTHNETLLGSLQADVKYYLGWTYLGTDTLAKQEDFDPILENALNPDVTEDQPVRYGIAVNRTVLRTFPTELPLWDDPADPDFDYQALSSIRVNEPMLIYNTSVDGKFYQALISCCSGWVPVEDVALCADKEEWLNAWDIPEEELLVVWGPRVYTAVSLFAPETSEKMLSLATRLRRVERTEADGLVVNRTPYHNYTVELPLRNEDGSYRKTLALIPQREPVSEGSLPLTQRNVASVILSTLGDTYGWGGSMGSEDCSNLVRLTYECFGLLTPRNGNWQWKTDIAKLDMTGMCLEERLAVLDAMPMGAALCFPGHEVLYLGKHDGNYYVCSSVSSVVNAAGDIQRTRSVILSTLDVRRANGTTWLTQLNKAFMIGFTPLMGEERGFPQAEWYHDGVKWAVANKVMALRERDSFGVEEGMTREGAALALWKLAGSPEAAQEPPFPDLSDEAQTAAHWAAEQGLLDGSDSAHFGGAELLSREDFVSILWRFAHAQGVDTAEADPVQWARGLDILQGMPDGGLHLEAPCTRSQAAVLLCRYQEATAPAE